MREKALYEGMPQFKIEPTKIKNILESATGSSQLATDVYNFSFDLIQSGIDSFNVFKARIYNKFKDIWKKLKPHLQLMWDTIRNEKGRVVLREEVEAEPGVVKFQETLEPITQQDYIANRASNKSVGMKATSALVTAKKDATASISKMIVPISTRLGRINERLKHKVRKLDYDIAKKSQDDINKIVPLLRKGRKMTRDDAADWDYARKNSDKAKLDQLIEKYGMTKEYVAAREVFDDLREKAWDVGLSIGKIEDYWTRRVKDLKGLYSEMGLEQKGVYTQALDDRAKELDMEVSEMDDDVKANLIVNIILGGPKGLGGVSAAKKRKFRKVPARLNKYYYHSDTAAIMHIHEMQSAIEKRKFFGKIPEKVAEMRKQLNAAKTRVRNLNKEISATVDSAEQEKLKKRRNDWIGRTKQLQVYLDKYAAQRDYKENIGIYIDELISNKQISYDQQNELNNILTARFHEKGTHGFWQLYKNFSYLDTMGSPVSALTQIGDSAWAMYSAGAFPGLKHAIKSIPPKKYKNVKITREDVGVTHIAQEFADPGTLGKAVSWVFKAVGLEKIDAIGKEALLNASLEKYQKQAKANREKLATKLKPIFEGETDEVINDLLNDRITENVKYLVYSRLADFQPVALSEMPEFYLKAGNGRLFYMLKTFTIKQFDAFRNEGFQKIIDGTRNRDPRLIKQGVVNLTRLAMFFVLANATADELKDLLLRRKTDLGDRVVDNVLRLAGSSKFITWKARTEGIGSALARQVLPPFKFIDSVSKDIYNAGDDKGLEVTGSVPLVGKLAYWHIGRGVSKREDLWDRRLRQEKSKFRKYKEMLDESDKPMAIRSKYRKELVRLKQIYALQGRLNSIRRRIKRLEKTGAKKVLIQRLKEHRINLIKQFLNKK
jgi:hypothetical protein